MGVLKEVFIISVSKPDFLNLTLELVESLNRIWVLVQDLPGSISAPAPTNVAVK